MSRKKHFRRTIAPMIMSLLLILIPIKAHSTEYTLFSRGNWEVVLSAPDGVIDRACIASGAFPAGFFAIMVFADEVMVSIYDRSLKIVGSVRGSLIIRISGNGVNHNENIRIQSLGGDSQSAVISRDIDEYLVDAIMRGLTMEIVYPDNTKWNVSLEGSYASVQALADCADQYLFAPTQSPNPWR